MSSVNEKLDAAETGYGSIKDEPKAGGGLKLIVIGMLIGTFIGVFIGVSLITPYPTLALIQEDQVYSQCIDRGYVCQILPLPAPREACCAIGAKGSRGR